MRKHGLIRLRSALLKHITVGMVICRCTMNITLDDQDYVRSRGEIIVTVCDSLGQPLPEIPVWLNGDPLIDSAHQRLSKLTDSQGIVIFDSVPVQHDSIPASFGGPLYPKPAGLCVYQLSAQVNSNSECTELRKYIGAVDSPLRVIMRIPDECYSLADTLDGTSQSSPVDRHRTQLPCAH